MTAGAPAAGRARRSPGLDWAGSTAARAVLPAGGHQGATVIPAAGHPALPAEKGANDEVEPAAGRRPPRHLDGE